MTANIKLSSIHTKKAALERLDTLERERDFMRRELKTLQDHKQRIDGQIDCVAGRLIEVDNEIMFEISTLPKNLMAERDRKYPKVELQKPLNILEFTK